jgi:hypothetical protein
MNAKERYWMTNLLHAKVKKRGREFNVFHNQHDKEMHVLETGVRKTIGRREFRKWIKQQGGICLKPLKTGEYIDVNGERQKLWGIE